MNSKRMATAGVLIAVSVLLSACETTSGSTRLDDTGNKIAEANGYAEPDTVPEKAIFYIQALRGGLMARMAGLKLSNSDRARGLEAEYKTLESAPSGQKVLWEGGNVRGEVMAAVPYQVGSQNCRQYTHTLSVNGGQPVIARGAACRNANGTWTPLA